jgi:hypothetical protein
MAKAEDSPTSGAGDFHRIGGGRLENLRLKPQEAWLNPPGISLLKSPTPEQAARQMREAFPAATDLHETSRVVGSASLEGIRSAGCDVISNPTRKLPNHHRLIHPEGVAGFSDENLKGLSKAFTDTGESES